MTCPTSSDGHRVSEWNMISGCRFLRNDIFWGRLKSSSKATRVAGKKLFSAEKWKSWLGSQFISTEITSLPRSPERDSSLPSAWALYTHLLLLNHFPKGLSNSLMAKTFSGSLLNCLYLVHGRNSMSICELVLWSLRGTVVPLLAVTQVLETSELLALLVGLLAARSWCRSDPRSPRVWWSCGRDNRHEGPQGKCGACLSFECDRGGGGSIVYSPSLYSLLSLFTSATVNYRCWDTVTGVEGEPK